MASLAPWAHRAQIILGHLGAAVTTPEVIHCALAPTRPAGGRHLAAVDAVGGGH